MRTANELASTAGDDGRSSLPRWQVDVLILPKAGVNDPRGEAIRGGLQSLRFAGVEEVRSGKLIRLWVRAESAAAAETDAADMSQRLLANPVIETFLIEVSAAEEESA